MDHTSTLTAIVVVTLIVFGVYRKAAIEAPVATRPHGAADISARQESASGAPVAPPPPVAAPTKKPTKTQLATITLEIEKLLEPTESIIQVHDYTSTSSSTGLRHVFDVTTFNQASTQALSKRLTCLHKADGTIVLLGADLISPITGALVRPESDNAQEIASELLMDGAEARGDAKFVRDKYAFITKPENLDLPPEPRAPGPGATPTDHIVHQKHMAEYRAQVAELRKSGNFTRRRVKFAPTDQTVEDSRKYPFSQPTSYGFARAETPTVDYSALQAITPLKDEGFFNSVALERSTLAIQYQ